MWPPLHNTSPLLPYMSQPKATKVSYECQEHISAIRAQGMVVVHVERGSAPRGVSSLKPRNAGGQHRRSGVGGVGFKITVVRHALTLWLPSRLTEHHSNSSTNPLTLHNVRLHFSDSYQESRSSGFSTEAR